MSDNDNKAKSTGKGNPAGWTEHQVLVYLLGAMESANWTPDYSTAPVPEGRNANGCRQKINKIKIALKPELDALKAGEAIADPAPASPTKKPTTPRKRKTKTDEDGATSEATPKKARGRPKKKAVTPEAEDDPENIVVKGESEGMEADA